MHYIFSPPLAVISTKERSAEGCSLSPSHLIYFDIMTKGTIGMNAGTIWNIMADKEESPMSFDALKAKTALSDADLWSAIGWLARENKIEINTREGQLLCFHAGRNFYY